MAKNLFFVRIIFSLIVIIPLKSGVFVPKKLTSRKAGSAVDHVLCMTQNSAEPPDLQLQYDQWACLCLNYTALKHNSK